MITGSGNGLGRNIAEAALKAGDNVVAGARRTEELAPLVAQYDARVKPVTLEVRDEAAAKAAVQLAVDTFGRLDVLVNNASYGQFAPFEGCVANLKNVCERNQPPAIDRSTYRPPANTSHPPARMNSCIEVLDDTAWPVPAHSAEPNARS